MVRSKGIFRRGRVYWITYIGLDGRQKWESVRNALPGSDGTLKADAEYLLACRRKEIAEGTEPPTQKRQRNFTFSQLAEAYKEFVENQKAYRSKLNHINQMKQEFGGVKIALLGLQLLESYQTKLSGQGKKPATINRRFEVLKHMFTKAVDWEMVQPEALRRIRRLKKLPENNRRLRYLSLEETRTLIDAAEKHLKPIIITAVNTGMRRGEILGLKWSQVDLKHGFILLDKTKSGARREIPINDTLKALLQGIVRRIDSPHVFHDPKTGKPYLEVTRSFNTACRRSKIRDFHFHDLRHTFASQLVMNGVDITTVSKLLGHTTLTMTLRYAHLAPDHLKSAVDVLSRLQSSPAHDNLHDNQQKRA